MGTQGPPNRDNRKRRLRNESWHHRRRRLVGSTTAFYLAVQDLVEEIVLIDINEKLLLAHTWDMEQAVMDVSHTRITSGGLEALAGCGLVIHCASVNESNAKSRTNAWTRTAPSSAPSPRRWPPGAPRPF